MKRLLPAMTTLFVVLLVPASLFGAAAYGEFQSRGCATALDMNATADCGDALMVWQGAAAFAIVGVIVLGLLWFVLPTSRRNEDEA